MRSIHDSVLIATAFCMFNRRMDEPGAWARKDATHDEGMGRRLADQGHSRYDQSQE